MKKSVKSILNGLVMPILVVNQDMKISYANAAANSQFDLKKTGVALREVIESKKCLKATQRVLDGDPEYQVEITLQSVVPTAYRVNVASTSAEKDDDGPQAILSFEDISHVREAEQMRHDFVANVSHELRSPLTALVGFIETLQGPAKGDSEANTRFLKMMSIEAGRMARLINDLLSLSKLQAREREIPSEVTDLGEVIQSIVRGLGGPTETMRARVQVEMTGKTCLVKGDQHELTQVFQNLIENAIKYSPSESEVVIQSDGPKKKSNYICVSVRDHGEGIEPLHIPRLTERFYRIDKGRSRAMGGTGLGLAIVKHILIRHRGYLKIESVVGKGSVFSVFLPKIKD